MQRNKVQLAMMLTMATNLCLLWGRQVCVLISVGRCFVSLQTMLNWCDMGM